MHPNGGGINPSLFNRHEFEKGRHSAMFELQGGRTVE
jgi:hypothetical protein